MDPIVAMFSADNFPFKEAVGAFLIFVHVFQLMLEFRQLGQLKKTELPPQLKGLIKDEAFVKSRAYSLDKMYFGLVYSTFEIVQEMLILYYNVYAVLWIWIPTQTQKYGYGEEYEVIRSCIFMIILTQIPAIIGLPFKLYSVFVIEERHGFNKQTLGIFFKDKLKEFALLVVLVSLILAALIPIINNGGDYLALYMWGFIFTLSLVMMTLYPTLIAPLFNKYEPLEEGPLRTKIEKLAAGLNFPLKKLYVIDGSTRSAHSNAYLYGFFNNKRIVLYDTLLKQCKENEEEIVAVLAHELGHWKEWHTLSNFFLSQILTFTQFAMFTVIRNTQGLYSSFGFAASERPALISLMLFQLVISPLDTVLGFLMNVLSRRFEYQADAFAVKLGYGKELRAGLIRLQEENKSAMNIDPWYSAYHHSHPPLVERLAALDAKAKKTK